jgi:hypothetical protein
MRKLGCLKFEFDGKTMRSNMRCVIRGLDPAYPSILIGCISAAQSIHTPTMRLPRFSLASKMLSKCVIGSIFGILLRCFAGTAAKSRQPVSPNTMSPTLKPGAFDDTTADHDGVGLHRGAVGRAVIQARLAASSEM